MVANTIQVDCRRTDRTQPLFMVPTEAVQKGDEEKEAGGAGGDWEKKTEDIEEGGMARLNREYGKGALQSLFNAGADAHSAHCCVTDNPHDVSYLFTSSRLCTR